MWVRGEPRMPDRQAIIRGLAAWLTAGRGIGREGGGGHPWAGRRSAGGWVGDLSRAAVPVWLLEMGCGLG